MRNKIIFLALALFLFLPLVSAITSDYTFKQDSLTDLKRSCFNNGTWCSSTAVCNITIADPDNLLIVNNKIMTNQISYQNYTLNTSQNAKLGYYYTAITCIDSGYSGGDTFYYKITQTGTEPTTTDAIIYSVLFIGAFILFVLSLYGTIIIPFENHGDSLGNIVGINDLKYLKIFLGVMAYMLLTSLSFLGWSIGTQLLQFNTAGNLFYWVYSILVAGIIPIAVLSFVYAVIWFWKDSKIMESITRGVPQR